MNARPALNTLATPLEEIITQKYIANFLKVETWNDWRRTGYPKLTPVVNALLPNIPQRIRTPGSELSNNINQVTATGIPTGLDGMMVKVWWAVERYGNRISYAQYSVARQPRCSAVASIRTPRNARGRRLVSGRRELVRM